MLVVVGGTIGTLIKGRYTAAQWFDFVMFGLTIGSIYALIALGYTMVYGVLRLINFAHGDIMMTGAFAGYFVASSAATIRASSIAARCWRWRAILAVAVATSTIIAVLTERIAYRPFRRVRGSGAADLRDRRVVLSRTDVPRHVRLGVQGVSRSRRGSARHSRSSGFSVPRDRRAGDRRSRSSSC